MPKPAAIIGIEEVSANAPITPSRENEASNTSRYAKRARLWDAVSLA